MKKLNTRLCKNKTDYNIVFLAKKKYMLINILEK